MEHAHRNASRIPSHRLTARVESSARIASSSPNQPVPPQDTSSPKQTPQVLQPLLRRLRLIDLLPPHAQIRQHPLLPLQLEHLLLKRLLHDEPGNHNLALLAQPVHAVDGLRLGRRVELRLHDVDFGCRGEVEAEAAGGDGDQDDGHGAVGREGVQRGAAGGAGEAPVEARIGEAGRVERDLDEVEVRRPG